MLNPVDTKATQRVLKTCLLTAQDSYNLKDHLGSTRVVLDESGNAVAAYVYRPLGGEA